MRLQHDDGKSLTRKWLIYVQAFWVLDYFGKNSFRRHIQRLDSEHAINQFCTIFIFFIFGRKKQLGSEKQLFLEFENNQFVSVAISLTIVDSIIWKNGGQKNSAEMEKSNILK